jgi:chromosome segregation ATPase
MAPVTKTGLNRTDIDEILAVNTKLAQTQAQTAAQFEEVIDGIETLTKSQEKLNEKLSVVADKMVIVQSNQQSMDERLSRHMEEDEDTIGEMSKTHRSLDSGFQFFKKDFDQFREKVNDNIGSLDKKADETTKLVKEVKTELGKLMVLLMGAVGVLGVVYEVAKAYFGK